VAASFAAPTSVTLLDLDRLEVWAYVDETDADRSQARSTRNSPVRIRVNAMTSEMR
jgi:hypothetical protein